MIERARYYAKRLANKLHGVESDAERDSIIYATMDEIEEYTGTKFSIISDFTFDMLTGNCEPKSSEYSLDEMGYKVIQYII